MFTLPALQALALQLARIGMCGAGVYELVHGQQATGWALITASGVTAVVDVAKVAKDVQSAKAMPPPAPPAA